MPIEIRELVIKATVSQEESAGASGSPASSLNNAVSANEEMINACVEKVLEILKEKYDR